MCKMRHKSACSCSLFVFLALPIQCLFFALPSPASMRWMGYGQVRVWVCCFGAASARIESCSFCSQALVTCCRRANAENLKMVALLEWRLAKSSLRRPPSIPATCSTHKFILWQPSSSLLLCNWYQSDLGWTGVLMKDVQLQNTKENG